MNGQSGAPAFRTSDIAVAAAVVAVVAMMIVPLPTMLLDVLLTFNVAAALVILLVSIFTLQPLQFSGFPPLLLITTLFRLSLNVSTTRKLLLTGEAGEVIKQFGEFVVGGNTAVGLIVFLILIIVNFIVITKGSERVSEVAARFTLDAMPGKQMAIDADLNAGLITEGDARRRRQEIQRESDFYGAMDGASKFVKGDAVAGLIICAVNLVGGLIVGMMQQEMGFSEAWSHFSLRTVGDGLISQIPALLISTATGIVVTRTAGETGLGDELGSQLFGDPTLLIMAGGVIGVLGLVPGLPTLAFLTVGGGLLGLGYLIKSRQTAKARAAAVIPEPLPITNEAPPENVVALMPVDPLEVELGYALVPLAEAQKGGDLLERVVAVRKQVATNLGLLIPYIRVRDNLGLAPYQYVVKLRGIEVGSYELQPDRVLAMAPGDMDDSLPGQQTVEPAFGLPGVWIAPSDRQRAELMGYTVVDPVSVVIAHLTEVIKEHANELLGRQEVRAMVDTVKESHPALIDELTPALLTLGEIQKVLSALLTEGVPIRDLVLIFETLADWAGVSKDTEQLTERCRAALGRTIVQHLGLGPVVHALTLAPDLEQQLIAATDRRGGGGIDPNTAQALVEAIAREGQNMAMQGHTPALVCAPALRPVIRRIARHAFSRLIVLSYAELDPKLEIEAVGVIRV
ncbi:MAG TPA: flagellar biosynthesis protein FlhA [Symbiobacteriaceae bacterium]|nr:flagellar biosynthesis protein FlhA [Symbiobacteriaceae bacterium]